MVLFWELKFFDLMVRHHAGVVSENNKRGWNFANSHILISIQKPGTKIKQTNAHLNFDLKWVNVTLFTHSKIRCKSWRKKMKKNKLLELHFFDIPSLLWIIQASSCKISPPSRYSCNFYIILKLDGYIPIW